MFEHSKNKLYMYTMTAQTLIPVLAKRPLFRFISLPQVFNMASVFCCVGLKNNRCNVRCFWFLQGGSITISDELALEGQLKFLNFV